MVELLCTHICNGKMRLVETIPGMGGGRKEYRKVMGVNSVMIYCKNFCKCHNIPTV
jgi:hypothetical protein